MRIDGLRIKTDSANAMCTRFVLPDGSHLQHVRSFMIRGGVDQLITADIETMIPGIEVVALATVHDSSITSACSDMRRTMNAVIKYSIKGTHAKATNAAAIGEVADEIMQRLDQMETMLNGGE